MTLASLGFTPVLARAFATLATHLEVPFEPGRVVRQDGLLHVRTETAQSLAAPSGKLSSQARSAEELPVIGDWVAITQGTAQDQRHVLAVAPRTSLLLRRMVGEAERAQPMAANVDRVLVVLGLDVAPNLRRLERSLTWARNAGALPVVVLNKEDSCENLASVLGEVRAVSSGVDVVTCSARAGTGLSTLRDHLPFGQTALLLGASGVGKSSIVNALLGEAEALRTHAVRSTDGKGRHTTTHREIRLLPHGALLMDVPGVRELGLWSEGSGLQESFDEISLLAEACRFRDCSHGNEPGCAVRAALEAQTLSPERLESFLKLGRELHREQARTDVRAALARKQKEKALTTSAWSHSRDKRKR